MGLVGQRLVLCQFAGEGIDVPGGAQLVEQEIALCQQGVAAPAGMDHCRCVREYSKRGALSPGQLVRRHTEVAPGGSLDSYDISSERRI